MSDVDFGLLKHACDHLRHDLRVWLNWHNRQQDPADVEAKLYGSTQCGLAEHQAKDGACELAATGIAWGENVDALKRLMAHGLRKTTDAIAALDNIASIEARTEIEILRRLRARARTVAEAAAQLEALAADKSLDPYRPDWAHYAIGIKLLDAIRHGAFSVPPFAGWASRWASQADPNQQEICETLIGLVRKKGHHLDAPTHSGLLLQLARAIVALGRSQAANDGETHEPSADAANREWIQSPDYPATGDWTPDALSWADISRALWQDDRRRPRDTIVSRLNAKNIHQVGRESVYVRLSGIGEDCRRHIEQRIEFLALDATRAHSRPPARTRKKTAKKQHKSR